MSILVWILGVVAYMAYLIYLFGRPSDLNLGLGILALLLGFISFMTNKKFFVLLAFVVLFAGVVLTYPAALARNQPYIWIGGLAAMLFFGTLSLRND